MRVLLISHTCQSKAEGQPKAHALAAMPDMQLCVLVPNIWKHYGDWREAEAPADPGFEFCTERVRWPWMGPAQFYLHWYPRLARLLKEFQPDVIDLWEEPWGLVSAHACWLRNRLVPAAKIVSETEQNIEKSLPFPFERFRSYVLRHADYAVGRSAEALSILRRKGFNGPAEVVPNAVDAELFRPLDRRKCREELGVNGFVVGYVGRLVPEKGIEDLLDALMPCPDQVNLLVVGQATKGQDWQQQVRVRNLQSRVRLIGGVPSAELPRIMNAMDVLALPSRTTPSWKEQFGRVVIEAHACGVPVIGSDSGAIPDVVGEGGLIVPESNPQALAQAIRRLMEEPGLAREMGRMGRQQVESQYTWTRVAERMRDIYFKAASPVSSLTQVLV